MFFRSKTPLLLQSERSECGLVSLAMVAGAHGLEIDLPAIRSRYALSLRGATLRDLITVARGFKLEVRALRCEPEDLGRLRLPAILHWRMDHFVVLIGRRGDRFLIHDPAHGKEMVSQAEMDRSFTGVALEAWPGPEFVRRNETKPLALAQVMPRMRDLTGSLARLFILALGVKVAALAIPILQQFVIDDALLTGDEDLLTVIAIAMAVALCGSAVTTAVRGLVQRNMSSMLSLVVPAHVFRSMIQLPAVWFERRFAADVINRIESANVIHRTITTGVVGAGIDGTMAVVALAIMLVYSPLLSAIVIAAMICYGGIRLLRFGALRSLSQGLIVQNAKVQSFLWETMRGVGTLKLFNGQDRREEQYVAGLSRSIRLQNDVATANTQFVLAHDLLVAFETVAVIYIGARSVLAGQLSIGMLVAFLSFRSQFVGSVSSLINAAVDFRMLSIHLARVADILLSEPERSTPLPFLGEPEVAGALEVRNVSYRYGSGEVDVLKNCQLSVRPGEILAIVGPSGAGKSTLMKVLSGQLEPREGDVLLDGDPIRSIGLRRLRDLIAVVRQDDVLFSGTIAENISCFDDHPDLELIRSCAGTANVLRDVERMPMGFNTLVGDMGSGLSGGQVQRLLLARALYRRPRILLLDEATSHLDLENEKAVSMALKGLSITQIIIAHRPETIAKADRVVDIREINQVGAAVAAAPAQAAAV